MQEAAGGNEIYWVVTVTVQPERLDDFKQVVAPLVAEAKREPGTLAYEFSVGSDRSTVHIFERYRDSNAVVSHVADTFGKFAERFLALAKVTSFVIYGAPSAEAREILAGFNPVYMTRFDGFTR